MKILLDECVTKRLKADLQQHEVFTVCEMGWLGIKNGELLKRCVENKFDIVLTIDKNMLHQQNIDKYDIALVVFNSPSSKIETLRLFLPEFSKRLGGFALRQVHVIELK